MLSPVHAVTKPQNTTISLLSSRHSSSSKYLNEKNTKLYNSHITHFNPTSSPVSWQRLRVIALRQSQMMIQIQTITWKFTRPRRKSLLSLEQDPELHKYHRSHAFIEGEERVTTLRVLGVLLDSKLTMLDHVSQVLSAYCLIDIRFKTPPDP